MKVISSVSRLLWLIGLLLCWSGCQEKTFPCGILCEDGFLCHQGKCRLKCNAEEFFCDPECIDPRKDPKHCGKCNNACKSDEQCILGTCTPECPTQAPQRCGLTCVNFQIDARHCGGCDAACEAGQSCEEGKCRCAPGTALCKGKCVILESNVTHCGQCDNTCTGDALCARGRCIRGTCPSASPDVCFGGCVDLSHNRFHCGSCGSQCSQQQVCSASTCGCPKDFVQCGEGICVDPVHDPNHCGKCNNACKKGQFCAEGRCIGECPKATPTSCFGGCVDTTQNALHCGGCSKRCEPGLQCKTGICCAIEHTICEGKCVDTLNDAQHCGKCGNQCPAGGTCIRGQCCVDGCSFAKLFGGGGFTYGRAMGQDNQGNILFGGNISSSNAQFGTEKVVTGLDYEVYVAKVTPKGDVLWVRTFVGDSGNDNRAYHLGADANDNIYVTGRYRGSLRIGTTTLQSINKGYDAYVAKLDAQGTFVWAESIGGTGTELGQGITVNKQGEATICGYTSSPSINNISLKRQGSTDAYLARINSQGKLAWIRTGGASGGSNCYDIKQDETGHLYAVGTASGPQVSFGNVTTNTTGTSTWFGQFTPNGDAIWLQTLPGSQGYTIDYRAAQPDNILCVGGAFEGTATFGEQIVTSAGGFDGYVACFHAKESSADLLWMRIFAGPGDREFVQSIGIDPLLQIHVSGTFNSPTLPIDKQTLNNAGDWDLFIARYNLQGALQMADAIGGSNRDLVLHLEVTPNGGTFLGGSSSSTKYQLSGKVYELQSAGFATLLYIGP